MSAAGRLRRRIVIEAASEARDAHGGVTPTWATVAECWAEIEPAEGRILFAAGRHGADATHVVHIRYREGIVPRMRVCFGARILPIEAVINQNEGSRMLTLFCRESL